MTRRDVFHHRYELYNATKASQQKQKLRTNSTNAVTIGFTLPIYLGEICPTVIGRAPAILPVDNGENGLVSV
jgi:hypothetical protein